MTDALVVLVTAPDAEVAARLARTLVEDRLAACGNVLPGLRSIYRWEGQVHDEPEALLLLKTTRALRGAPRGGAAAPPVPGARGDRAARRGGERAVPGLALGAGGVSPQPPAGASSTACRAAASAPER